MILGLEPVGDHLAVDPALPHTIGHLELLDIPGRGVVWTPSDEAAPTRLAWAAGHVEDDRAS